MPDSMDGVVTTELMDGISFAVTNTLSLIVSPILFLNLTKYRPASLALNLAIFRTGPVALGTTTSAVLRSSW